MIDHEYARKLEELDRLLNDPDVPMDPSRVWSLLADLSLHEGSASSAHEVRFTIGVAQTAQPKVPPGQVPQHTRPPPG